MRLTLYAWVVCVAVQLLDAHLGNAQVAELGQWWQQYYSLSGPARYEAVFCSCGTSLWGRRGWY